MLSFIALFLAIGLVIILLPVFNSIFNQNLPLNLLANFYVIPVLIAVVLFAGLAGGGSYPALFLSSCRPISTLKGYLKAGSGNVVMRKFLTTFQFVMSISLIIGSTVINKQISFIKNTDPGFDQKHLISIPLRAGSKKSYSVYKTELLNNPQILSVTGSTHTPTWIGSNTTGFNWEGKDPENIRLVHITSIGYDYLKTLRIELAQGRDF